MQKENVNILVVDDDQNLGKALASAIQRAGYKAQIALSPDEAINLCKFHVFHAAVVDCMLPRKSGRDLVNELKVDAATNLPVIMMSGIFRDRGFIRETLSSTKAAAFLTKPFEMTEFMAKLDQLVVGLVNTQQVERLHQFLSIAAISAKERIAAVDEALNVHGFDLPWIYNILMHPKVSGHLNIINAEGEVSSVAFTNGSIAQVFQEDAKSYFGSLLVEHGFISQADLDATIKTQFNSNKRLGERLIEGNLLSPHAIDLVIKEQQAIRLARTVSDTSVRINFVETEDMVINTMIERSTFCDLLNDWLHSKITPSWLKSYYLPYMNLVIKKGPDWSATHRIFSTQVVKRLPDFATKILGATSLQAALEAGNYAEDQFFRAVHALVVTRVMMFGEMAQQEDFESLKTRLNKVRSSLEKQNHYDRLGVSRKAKDQEIKRAYHELAKVFHPDKIPPDAPAEVHDLAKKTFEMIGLAYAVLSDNKAKMLYMVDLDRGSAELVLKAEQLGDQAQALLVKGDISQARKFLEESAALVPPSPTTKMLFLWAQIKASERPRTAAELAHLSEELSTIPAEDRHASLYLFVKALYMKVSGDLAGAKRLFEHALNQDQEFFSARRELNLLMSQHNSTNVKSINELLKGDLKDVVGILFRKKK